MTMTLPMGWAMAWNRTMAILTKQNKKKILEIKSKIFSFWEGF